MKKIFTYVAAAITLSGSVYAQEIDGCITNKAVNDYFNQHPEARKAFEVREALLEKQEAEAVKNGYKNTADQKNGQNSTQATIYYIPVVFQILHQNGAENIT